MSSVLLPNLFYKELRILCKAYIFYFNFYRISKRSDDYRLPSGNTKGGLNCMDQATMKKLRGVVKEVFKSIGKRIFKGKFNLTQISFPIKCMCPMSILQTFAASGEICLS